ncbi:MAG: caspase, EACC1-associated type [Blastocatellia bacterium]
MSEPGRRRAILIGSSRFDKEPKLTPLKCPENDVDGMYDIVASSELGAFEEPAVFKNADHQTILGQIEETLSDARAEDHLLIYYSGHGETDLPGRLYLTAADTQVRKLFSTSIPVETLRGMIEHYHCKRIMLILDCCFGGAAGKSFVKGSVDEQLKQLSRGSGIYILTASTASQTALEKEADDHSLLTKHIIGGIRTGEAADEKTGLVTMEDLYRYVHRQVIAEGHHEPMRWALNVRGEELVIARAGKSRLDRLRRLEDQVLESARRLPRKVRIRAQQVIDECQAQPGLHTDYIRLLETLFDNRMELGDFIDEWDQIEASERLQTPAQPPPVVVTPPQQEKNVPPLSPGSSKFKKRAALSPQQEKKTPPSSPVIVTPPQQEKKAPLRKPVESFTDDLNGVPLEMIYIPGGSFKMGAPEGVGNDNERPQHDVTILGFYIGKYQITQAQWEAVMGKNPSYFKGYLKNFFKGYFKGDPALPVENVPWNDAKQFCEKLAQMTGKAYRLPSEAEWEYACRAGTTGDYAGDLDAMAWYGDNSGSKTHPVGQKQPNAFGLYDMHGNVWEWCEDVWHDSYKGALTDGSAWLSGGDSIRRVLRGGSHRNNARFCRSAYRNHIDARNFSNNVGFRVVVSARIS